MKKNNMIMLFGVAALLAGCGEKPHTHQFVDEWSNDATSHWHVCADETCTEKGNEAEHTFEWEIDQAATYDAAGSKHEECTVCGYEKDPVEIPQLDHAYSSEWEKDETQHWHKCTDEGYEGKQNGKDVANHTAGEWIVDSAASFTADGSKHKECSVCGYVMETETIAKKTLTWTGVSIEEATDKVNLVLAGTVTGCASSDEILATFKFVLKTSSANIKRNETDLTVTSFDATTGNFVFKADVTDLSFETNPPYYMNVGFGSAADFKPGDGIVTANTIKLNGKTYELFYAKDSSEKVDGYGCVSLRVSETVNNTLTATGAHLEKTDSAVYYVVTGTSTGFASKEELAASLLFQLKTSGANIKRTQNDADVTFDVATGDFSLKFDITDLANATNPPYYTNIGYTGPGIKDFKPEDASKVTLETVKLNGKQYELIYGGTGASNGYGCVSVRVSDAGALALTPNAVSLEKVDDEAYYVVSGTSANFVSKEEFIENVVLEIRASGSSIVAGTSKEGSLYEFDTATGAFTLKVKITNVAARANPYYVRFSVKGVYAPGTTNYPNLNTVDSENVVRTPVVVGSMSYEIVYDASQTSSAAYGYGTISLKVSEVSE